MLRSAQEAPPAPHRSPASIWWLTTRARIIDVQPTGARRNVGGCARIRSCESAVQAWSAGTQWTTSLVRRARAQLRLARRGQPRLARVPAVVGEADGAARPGSRGAAARSGLGDGRVAGGGCGGAA